jgi:cytochrome b pre-mRNA-processing protein 3
MGTGGGGRVLARWLGRRPDERDVAGLYLLLVERSRAPVFFTRCGVPDTVDGRFDMIVLHAFLLFHRLKGEGAEAAALSQALFDHLMGDMDVNLRELGVSDMGVGRKIKRMAKAFYGRVGAYDRALAAGDDAALEEALGRNLFRTLPPPQPGARLMAGYVRAAAAALAATATAELLAGRLPALPLPSAEAAA